MNRPQNHNPYESSVLLIRHGNSEIKQLIKKLAHHIKDNKEALLLLMNISKKSDAMAADAVKIADNHYTILTEVFVETSKRAMYTDGRLRLEK